MKNSIKKAIAVTALGLIAATNASNAMPASRNDSDRETSMGKIETGTAGFAKGTWRESKAIARTVVYSPVIAWQVIRGERPMFPRGTASSHKQDRHEQIALTGHRAKTKPGIQTEMSAPARHNEPPPI